MKIVAISGSLRAGSSNAALLRAAVALAPADMDIALYEDMGTLPHFNPDLDGIDAVPPPAVAAFRTLLAGADGVLISSPEYAHGVPGSLKNALDWIVSSGELVDKPVVLLNAAPSGGEFAQAALLETLRTMSARVLVEASLLAPFVRKKLDPTGNIDDPEVARTLGASLAALATAISTTPAA
jgi:NAD(P)H-dependent FMN reductase